jgi:membrane protease YdiL (CAAX protease family)
MTASLTLFEFTLLDHVMALIICLIAPILAITSRNISTDEIQLEPGDKIKLYHSNALLLFVFALVVVTVWRIPGRALSGLGLTWPTWNPLVMQLIAAVFLFYALDVFFQYGTKRWRDRSLKHRNTSLAFVPADKKELIHFIFLALAAGIGEEIIFRGYLIHYLLYWTGNTASGILSAVMFASALFAFLHGYQGYRSMVKIFFLSLLFAGIFVYSQSLILVMLIHAIIDMLSGWLGIQLLKHLPEEESPEQESGGS